MKNRFRRGSCRLLLITTTSGEKERKIGKNIDERVVEGFGREWGHFDQSGVDSAELRALFDEYFRIFPWHELPASAAGFDLGCGSGRWAKFVAPRVGRLYCIDPSAGALAVARANLADCANCSFHLAGVDDIPIADDGADFGYSLGVLHHVPDTAAAIRACVRKLKPGAPLLLYLYFAFDNKPRWYRMLWKLSEVVRFSLSRAPFPMRLAVSHMIAALVYWPLARLARLVERVGVNVDAFPLCTYRNRSFYTMRTDALDRFGTRLEQRFSRAQIATMMEAAGLERIHFSDARPYWCAIGYKR